MKKSVLIIGGGGRESALVNGYGKSEHVEQIYVIPGNDLMQDVTKKPVTTFPNLKTTDVSEIIEICKTYAIDLVDIAQDNAVAAGLGDALEKEGIVFMGPKKASAQLEWDKVWSRQFMKDHNIPTPDFVSFSSEKEAIDHLDTHADQPWVVKAAGLAEGKGVIITKNNLEARQAIQDLQRFGEAGETFLLEQYLVGEEFSLFVVSDGTNWKIVGGAQDHKRVLDGDEGPNTGGMGCSSPPLVLSKEIIKKVTDQVIQPTIDGLNKMGRPYTGILYIGGMLVKNKDQFDLYIIEFNCRWGDPEAQVLVPSLETDIYEMAEAVVNGTIHALDLKVDKKARVVVVGAAKGYPIDYSSVKGKEILGLEKVKTMKDTLLFGAGIKRENNKDTTNGGRLFFLVAEGTTVIETRKKAYSAMESVSIEGDNLYYRTDIGWRDVARIEA